MKARHLIQAFFTILRLISDSLCIFAAFILAYIVKFKLNAVRYPHAQIEPYMAVLPYVIVLWLVAFILVGLYRTPKGLLARLNEASLIIAGVSFGTLEVMAFSFAYPPFPTSRFVMGYTFLFATILITLARFIIHSLELWFSKLGISNHSAVIFGTNHIAQTIGEKMLMYPTMGYHLLGFIDNKKPGKLNFHLRNGRFVFLGNIKDFAKILRKIKPDALFIARSELPEELIFKISTFCELNNIQLKMLPKIFSLLASSIDVNALDGIPLLSFKKISFSPMKKFIKRTFDILVSLVMLIITSPIMFFAAVAVKISSPDGPIIFKQVRVGENGRHFQFYKFRTMPVNVEAKTGPVWATTNQKQRTIGIGNLLRKTSIDELPQLFNVLKGDMSIVGPRPERPFFVEQLTKELPNYDKRHLVKGGITGWAQINGRAFLTSEPAEKLKYDIYYIENWSPLFDLKIVLKTVSDVLFQRNVF